MNVHHHHHDSIIIPNSDHDSTNFKKLIKYRECLKNHAAAMGGNATDGCGEFMPSGEEGSLEALTCSACNCHRNFHRKEIEGDPSSMLPIVPHESFNCYPNPRSIGRKIFVGHNALGYHNHPRAGAVPHQMIMGYNMGGSVASESEEERVPFVKKRFRTKFTQEQKDKMLGFAEKVGWKIQKQEEGVVQQFCQEVGVKRRVLKVWMHNNKHNLAKKNLSVNGNNNGNGNGISHDQGGNVGIGNDHHQHHQG